MNDHPSTQRPRVRGDSPALRIFVVEDHDDTRELLSVLLEQMGHTVVAASSMNEALRKLSSSDVDVLISDIGLPDGDGWELLRRLCRPIYAIAISGRGALGDRARSFAAGYHHYLQKPTGSYQLAAILQSAAHQLGHACEQTQA